MSKTADVLADASLCGAGIALLITQIRMLQGGGQVTIYEHNRAIRLAEIGLFAVIAGFGGYRLIKKLSQANI
jgi:hypothetical protein